jgi:transposase-like protein
MGSMIGVRENGPMTGVSADGRVTQEVEVVATAQRRRFTAAYKRRILHAAERCTKPGEVGALLRREGLYSSNLTAWRAAQARGELAGDEGKRRGPKPKPPHPEAKRILQLERENRRLRARAERAEALVEVQKKLSALLHQADGLNTEPR